MPGDVVRVSAFERIPADMILFECREMKVNNMNVTGEYKDLQRSFMTETNIFESPNVCFSGTECTAGMGTGMVMRTGEDTILGRLGS